MQWGYQSLCLLIYVKSIHSFLRNDFYKESRPAHSHNGWSSHPRSHARLMIRPWSVGMSLNAAKLSKLWVASTEEPYGAPESKLRCAMVRVGPARFAKNWESFDRCNNDRIHWKTHKKWSCVTFPRNLARFATLHWQIGRAGIAQYLCMLVTVYFAIT